ncbi:TonB-dependent receptor [Cesiribacter andamanensis]|uniref:Outer membrane receptor for ferrienterochelin and colicin n=1 Tax=Cesiribacter andamanensis AMV16 TaxID=1279009 RepID=M7N6M3_9BACT|nr:TonB-dependent receptor [Cesiribacter andamanensis]EMR02876.1 Outer membrane receptor for ferrienterochelin and colicin [Cesiribacter andamanensis AMV16]
MLLVLQLAPAQAQTALLRGSVRSQEGLPLPGAAIQLVALQRGTVADTAGTYSLSVPAGDSISLRYSYLGYRARTVRLLLQPGEQRELHIQLAARTDELRTVEVTSDQGGQREEAGLTRIDPIDAVHIPTAFGDFSDILQTLPGVMSNNELSSAYAVRGGNFDENLVYVNGIPIYRPFLSRAGQQEGLSFVNPQMVQSIRFSAGGWQPKWGDKLSSVLDITYKQPDSIATSLTASLLGGNLETEGSTGGGKFTWVASARHKSARYLLGTLETEGEYLPRFSDIQAFLTFTPSQRHQFNLLLSYARNRYEVAPQTRETNFGTLQQAFRLTVGFEGQELLRYDTYQNAVKWSSRWSERFRTEWILSWLNTRERELADVEGAYFLCNVDKNTSSATFDQCQTILGLGTNYLNIRNSLKAQVYTLQNRSQWQWTDQHRLEWGLELSQEQMQDRLQEWEFIDSAGYISIRDTRLIDNGLSLSSQRLQAYVQNSSSWGGERHTLTYGLRSHYWTINEQLLFSPRLQYAYRPIWATDIVFSTAMGIYHQPPLYRELRTYLGEVNLAVRAQSALHLLAGADMNFLMWNRPFNLVGEGYYKKLWHVNAYDIENVRLRYFANNEARAWATGADFRISGEFIPGAESWFSLGVMSTREDILGDGRGYIRRPTDQRLNVGIFFQDHLPNDPSLRAYMRLLYGSGLPFGPPERPEYRSTFTAPAYQRVDIGLSKILDLRRHNMGIRSLWVGLEILNLLANQNVISYSWVSDFGGRQYAVPNTLSSRFFNVKLVAQFNKKAAL